jgi:hypothetical protein
MDNRYEEIDDDDLIRAVDKLEVFLPIVDQTVDQEAIGNREQDT